MNGPSLVPARQRCWYPVVYGRTLFVDQWWRVVPAHLVDDLAWLRGPVEAVFGGGYGLEEGPRFLFAQDTQHRLVGVAARAHNLSSDMNTDRLDGGRALNTFVGWLAKRDLDGFPAVPRLDDWRLNGLRWATPSYEHWVRLDWGRSETSAAHTAEPGTAPWPALVPPERNEIGVPPGRRVASTSGITLVPERDAEAHWSAAVTSDHPICLTTGWTDQHLVPRRHAMVAAAWGVEYPQRVALTPDPEERLRKAEAAAASSIFGAAPTIPTEPPALGPVRPDHSGQPGSWRDWLPRSATQLIFGEPTPDRYSEPDAEQSAPEPPVKPLGTRPGALRNLLSSGREESSDRTDPDAADAADAEGDWP